MKALGIGLGVVVLVIVGIIGLAAAGLLDWGRADKAGEWGRFVAPPQITLLDNGVDIQLTEDFAYVDPRGRVWTAPKNSVVNGASIPRVFHTLVGSPLTGSYRNASIIHDVGVDRMVDPWEQVHLCFYEGCRCGGVPENKAKVLYAAVYYFCDRWEIQPNPVEVGVKDAASGWRPFRINRQATTKATRPQPTPDDVQRLEKFVNDSNPSLEDIRKWKP